ncbi:hypothetical protein [Gordonia sp. (in: high G+C Gram-positive bacteria)]|uniref:hypothetical protein n=1 Tax=Gordonia sp. (in: high G+C Gram-positive bacteria) TaxID=84139 RepID=UPI003BB54C6A
MSFAALAVLLAAGQHSERPLPLLITLLVTTVGRAAAIRVADLISHAVVQDRLMSADIIAFVLARPPAPGHQRDPAPPRRPARLS